MPQSDGTVRKRKTATTARRPASRWTINGVTKKTRDAVARAAKKDGVTVGKWVDQTLRQAAETQLKGGHPNLSLPPDLLNLLDDLSRNVQELNDRRSFGDQALQQIQESASEVGERVSSTYEALSKRADPAIGEIRSAGDRTIRQVTETASQLGERVASTYESLSKSAEPAFEEIRSWTDETLEKWGDALMGRLKSAAESVERWQKGAQEKAAQSQLSDQRESSGKPASDKKRP